MANSLFSVGLEKHGPPRPFPFLRGYLLLAAAQQGLPECSGQCVRGPWFLEQRLLKKCKYRFIALRSFVICVITPQQGEGNQIIISTAGKASGATLVPLCSAGGWIPSAGPWSSNSAEGREGGETATTEGWRDGLNSQTASHLVVALWERELPHMPVLCLLTNSSQQLQHSQWGCTESWDVLGCAGTLLAWARLLFPLLKLGLSSRFPGREQAALSVPLTRPLIRDTRAQEEGDLCWERLCRRISSCFCHRGL